MTDRSTARRSRRRELILTFLSQKPIHNQDEMLRELSRHGVETTQSTLSRELKALGIAKAPDGRGGYRYIARGAATQEPLSAVAAFLLSVVRAGNLLVLKTPPGNAQGVARGIDQADWPEVLGTVGGDDTILVVCGNERLASQVEQRLKLIARG